MITAIVSSALANKPGNGGNAWAVLNWVLGLQSLGCRVLFVEQIDPAGCTDATGQVVPFEQSRNRAYFAAVLAYFGLSAQASLLYDQGTAAAGLSLAEVERIAADADLLLNISGHLQIASITERVRRRVYLDLDPGFTQFWHASGSPGPRLAGHDAFFTIGENIGRPGCNIPTGEIPWHPIRPPVVLDMCTVGPAEPFSRFTTVANWRGPYGPITYEGTTYGLKVHEFRRFLALPGAADRPFELALSIYPEDGKDRAALEQHGWHLVDPEVVVPDPAGFQAYIQQSGAEFSVAQGVYVGTGSGWFSDRTVHYLACGKPALVQDTGFSRNLPVGQGLLAFRTFDEALAGVRAITDDYPAHCAAARALAERYFDSDTILGRLLDQVGLG